MRDTCTPRGTALHPKRSAATVTGGCLCLRAEKKALSLSLRDLEGGSWPPSPRSRTKCYYSRFKARVHVGQGQQLFADCKRAGIMPRERVLWF